MFHSTKVDPNSQRRVKRLIAGFILVALLSGCAAPPPAKNVARVAIGGSLTTLNPIVAFTYDANAADEAIFDGLVKIDPRGDAIADLITEVPSLANGDISPDGKTITYHLRHGVVWHDGAPFTATDVAFTYGLLRNPKINGPHREPYRNIISLTTPDAYTVVVRLAHPDATAIRNLFCIGNNGAIVPEHILKHSRDINTDEFASHPIGTGPYEFESWDRGSRLVLRANRSYFGGAPGIEHLELLEINNENTLLAQLQTSQIDVASVPTALLHNLDLMRNVRTIITPSYGGVYLAFNLQRPALQNRQLRGALALALDRVHLTKVVTNDTGVPAESLWPPFGPFTDATVAPGYDVQRAAALIRGMPPINVTILASNGPLMRELQLSIAQAWQGVGVHVDLRTASEDIIYSDGGPLMKGDFDVAIVAQTFDADPDRSAYITTPSIPPAGTNYARYSDPDIDKWSAAALETNDPAQRTAYYQDIQAQLNRDQPYIPILWIAEIHAINRRLSGYEPETINSQFWNVAQWRV